MKLPKKQEEMKMFKPENGSKLRRLEGFFFFFLEPNVGYCEQHHFLDFAEEVAVATENSSGQLWLTKGTHASVPPANESSTSRERLLHCAQLRRDRVQSEATTPGKDIGRGGCSRPIMRDR
ncbi:hypothetical protein INR49_026672 [Caranx melampygus]|nr:hypothetical protein INR49_026672 [Caranx melampygus]